MITSPLRQVLHGNIGSEVSCLLENLRTGSQVYQMKGEDGKRYQAYYMKQYKAAMTEQIRNLADRAVKGRGDQAFCKKMCPVIHTVPGRSV